MKNMTLPTLVLLILSGSAVADPGFAPDDSLAVASRAAALQEAYRLKVQNELDQDLLSNSPCRVIDVETKGMTNRYTESNIPECAAARARLKVNRLRVVQLLGRIYLERFNGYKARLVFLSNEKDLNYLSLDDVRLRQAELKEIEASLEKLDGAIRADAIQEAFQDLSHKALTHWIQMARTQFIRFGGSSPKPAVVPRARFR